MDKNIEKEELIKLIESLENKRLIVYITSFVRCCIEKWGK